MLGEISLKMAVNSKYRCNLAPSFLIQFLFNPLDINVTN